MLQSCRKAIQHTADRCTVVGYISTTVLTRRKLSSLCPETATTVRTTSRGNLEGSTAIICFTSFKAYAEYTEGGGRTFSSKKESTSQLSDLRITFNSLNFSKCSVQVSGTFQRRFLAINHRFRYLMPLTFKLALSIFTCRPTGRCCTNATVAREPP